MPLVEVSDGWAVALDAAAWASFSFVIGYGTHRLRPEQLEHDTALTRLRGFERGGRWYERRLRIRAWKDRLPEAGGLFAGGVSKRRLPGHSPDDLRRFVRETRRAELTHWLILGTLPLFAIWNRPVLLAAMGVYAVAANVPCLLVQRFNRARLLRVLERAERAGSVAR